MGETFQWVEPDGTVHALDGTDSLKLVLAANGRYAPPPRVVEDQVPFVAGTRVRSVTHDARDITWPALVRAADESALRSSLRTWAQRMDPARGNGRLRITGPDASVRELACFVTDGLELDETNGYSVLGWYKTVLRFRAPWPYWLPTSDTTVVWASSDPPSWFPWEYPWVVGDANLFTSNTVDVDSDVDVQPVWLVTGPGSSLVLTHRETGRRLAWTGGLGAGEVLTIDTRGDELTATPYSVIGPDGTDRWGELAQGGYDMWPLVPGEQTVDVLFEGTDSGSSVALHYRPNLLTV